MNVVKNEPALITGLISAVIALAVGFGLSWTPEQVGWVMAVVVAIQAIITRAAVTPNNKLQDLPPVYKPPVV